MECESGKQGFDKKGAQSALNRISKSHKRQDRYPIRKYECEVCGQWHITGKTENNDGGKIRPVVLKNAVAFRKYIHTRRSRA